MELVTSFIPEATVKGRALAADQEFQRQLKQWEFAIEKQKLFREDIRDLVELTVGRMDMYHLVGALLLELCMLFYCQNEMLSAEREKYPTWLISLFMMSNFSAVGFLTLAVWFSMHASVASHSIGVRLLLRLIRPDVPGAEAISNVSVPLASWLSGTKGQPLPESIPAAVQPIDERNHFKEFLQRQRSWTCYDAYARGCMCLGMNSMLNALSYYIIGRIAEKSAVSAVSALLGVQLLSVLLLVLDIRHDRRETSRDGQRCFMKRAVTNCREACAVLFLRVLPPIYSLILVWEWDFHWLDTRMCSDLSTISFLLHAGWLRFIYEMSSTSTADLLPRRIRAVEFIDVMSPDELELGAEDAAENIKEAHEQLRICMERGDQMHMLEGFRDELMKQVQSAQHVRSMAFAAEQPDVPDGPQEAREAPRGSGMELSRQTVRVKRLALERNLRQALHLLTVLKDVYFLWETAPLILGSTTALLAVDSLKPDEQIQLKRILEEFPKQYSELRQQMQSGIQRGDEHIYFAMGAITEEDPLPVVAVEEEHSGTRVPVIRWYRPEDRSTALLERPTDRRATTFNEAVTSNSAWRRCHALLLAGQGSVSLSESGFEFSAARNFTISSSSRQNSAAERERDSQQQQQQQLPQMVDRMPRDVVRVFVRGCMFFWLLAALAHLADGLSRQIGDDSNFLSQQQRLEPPILETRQLVVKWPSPAALFEVSDLHCANNSVLLVSSRFGLYGAQWQPSALGAFEQVARQPAAAVVCGGSLCSAFIRGPSRQDEWILAPITQTTASLRDPLAVPIPAGWRIMSAMWKACSFPFAPCESAVLAGWTGAEVLIAEAYRKIPSGVWQLQTSFAVRPELAVCGDEHAAVSCSATGGRKTYEDVQALHLGPGRVLTVLLSMGRLDAWDLASGAFLGGWHIGAGGNYTAMCTRGHDVVLARRGGRLGPQLHVATLPFALSKDARTGSF
eukprot:TRINITY_DN276_c2_g2_i2.p1 TRINITY_DN276_c2_g2~~TRINITY_DN276_c2_g2_i2.p1  ORF type:complete len:962 (-),score=155.32 TRINITY_DN276_c2_g2_i2:24-2909(-)